MRFEVGKVYTFSRILFEPGRDRFGSMYIPWEDTLTKIEVINLTCKEHHKVAWDQDPNGEKKYDGFVLTDDTGQIWYNQYPSACYGQMDDTNDRVVFPHFETEELMQKGGPADQNDGWIKRTDDEATKKWKFYDSYFWDARLELATNRLGNIYRCINPTKKGQVLPPEKRKLLQEFLDQMITAVETISQQTVIFEPLVFRYLDERTPEASKYVMARLSGDDTVQKLAQKYVPINAILSREAFEEQIKVNSKFYRVIYAAAAHPRFKKDPILHEAERAWPTGISETGDDIEDAIQFFQFRYAGRHFDSGSYLDFNVSRLNDYNNNFLFARKKDAEAYLAFIQDPRNASYFS